MSRLRSPNYPALSLPDAVEKVRDVFKAQQTTPEPREVVMNHMGYSGSSGRALKALSALIKYGLLEEAGDQELRVSDRAVAILFPDPDNPESKSQALLDAASEPRLFSDIFMRWDTRPSESSLKAFLIRNGFNANALDNVARAFYETFDLVEDLSPQGGHSASVVEELIGGRVDTDRAAESMREKINLTTKPAQLNDTKPVFDFETVQIHTTIDNKVDLDELIRRLKQIREMLPDKSGAESAD